MTEYWNNFWAKRNKWLNDPEWLSKKVNDEEKTPAEIAVMFGCDEKIVLQKITEMGADYKDKIFGTHTGYFHRLKPLMMPIIKPVIKHAEKVIDIYYYRTLSTNSKLFKQIIYEMETLDRDTQASAAYPIGYSRKAFYILMLKLAVLLYEFDEYYAERFDYIIKRILEANGNSIYIDETADPKNWYPVSHTHPDRDPKLRAKHWLMRNKEKRESRR